MLPVKNIVSRSQPRAGSTTSWPSTRSTPAAATDADADALREAGFSDRDILDITEVVGYYAYANRIADGPGLQTEDWIPD